MRLMKSNAGLTLIVAAIATVALGAQQPTFRSSGVVVPVFVTVTDGQQRLVTDLVESDFEVLDNDKLQKLTVFDNRYRPISIVVLLDTSLSMTGNLKLLRAAAEQFIIRLFPQDEARIGAFHDRIELSAKFTSDRDSLISDLRNLDFGNSTRLYDALDFGLDALQEAAERRVILVLTDGDDSGSKKGANAILERARADEVMVYVIGLQSDFFNGVERIQTRPDRGLKRIAEETGGGYFVLDKTSELGSTFTRVAQELHSQYVLGFTPASLDSKVHKLTTKVRRPGMTARARRSYVATPKTAQGNRSSGGF
jgi:Ca-activated chloride channel family protein